MTEREIFDAALAIVDPASRATYLEDACGGDAALRDHIAGLLEAHLGLGSFLELPGANVCPTIDQPSLEKPGAQIGPYKLLQQIGEGGFGVVYMAEQTEPVRRKVALKVIKPGMDTRQVIARFEAERQALAVMDHPNIARVFDAGTTQSGRPYFVMELVRGIPLTQYCDENNLPIRERLELFATVCQAIQHAHTKGIIHRDIKPTNVLVTRQDGQPVVKVIDFGVAKAMGQSLTDKTLFTEFAQMIGTPLYMSPEQAELSSTDIDTRSDIYSLGVLLYELLTGTTPVSKEQLKQAAFDEIRRIIREDEPPKPSTRISTAESAPSIAAQRHSEPAKLAKLVRGELDWIVMKALEKDRSRRYETASGFARDIERYLSDEPVQACPPSAAYRLHKFARRNKLLLVTGGLIGLSLVVGTVVSVWQAVRAVHAEHLAQTKEQKARDAVNEYFTLVSQNKLLDMPGLEPLRRDLLEAALRYYEGMLDWNEDNPAVLADIAATHMRVSTIYHRLDRNDDSLVAIEKAIPIVERLLRDYPSSHEQQCQLAGVLKFGEPQRRSRMPKDPDAARRTLLRAIELWKALAKENPSVEGFQSDIASLHFLLGELEGGVGYAGKTSAFAQAVEHLQETTAILDALNTAHPEDKNYLQFAAGAYGSLGWHSGKAENKLISTKAYQRAQELENIFVTRFPNDLSHRSRRATQNLTSGLGLLSKAPDQAEQLIRQALSEFEALVTAFPKAAEFQIELARCNRGLHEALVLQNGFRTEEEIKCARKAVEIYERLLKDFPERRQSFLETQGHNYRFLAFRLPRVKDYAGARASLEASSEMFRQGAENAGMEQRATCFQGRAENSIHIAWLWEVEGRGQESQQACREALERYELILTEQLEKHIAAGWINNCHIQLAGVLGKCGTPDDALRILPKLHPPGRELNSAGLRGVSSCYVQIARILLGAGRKIEGAEALHRAQEVIQEITRRAADGGKSTSADRFQIAKARLDMVVLQDQAGLRQDAQQSLQDAAGLLDPLVKDARVDDALRKEIGHTLWSIAESFSHFEDHARAESLMQLGLDVFGQLEKSQPKQPTFRIEQGFGHRLLAGVMERTGRKEETERHLLTAVGFYGNLAADLPESDFQRLQAAHVHNWLGRIYAESDRWNEAAAAYTRSIEILTTYHEPWSGRAWVHFHDHKWEQAIADYSKAIELAPKVHTNWFHRGHAHLQLAQWDKAEADFTKVVEGWPDVRDGWYLRALAYAQSNQPEKAMADLRQAVATGFKDIVQLKNEPQLAPLRSRDDFKKLLAELEAKKMVDP